MVEKEVLHSAASSALAASRALLLLMPTRALQAVSFRSAPSARFIWYLCRVDGVEACSLIKDAESHKMSHHLLTAAVAFGQC